MTASHFKVFVFDTLVSWGRLSPQGSLIRGQSDLLQIATNPHCACKLVAIHCAFAVRYGQNTLHRRRALSVGSRARFAQFFYRAPVLFMLGEIRFSA